MMSRYGYPSLDVAEAVVANYSAASIPLEAMWLDIDYMHGFRDYTFDAVNFPADRVAVRPLPRLFDQGIGGLAPPML